MSQALQRAIDRHRLGDAAGALAAAFDGLKQTPDDVELLHFAGMVAMATGDVSTARRSLEQAVAVAPQGLQLTSLARLLAQTDPEALAKLPAGPMAGPAGDEYLSLRASARKTISDDAGAADDLEQLHRRRPADRAIALAAAAQLVDGGANDRAEVIYLAMVDRDPADHEAALGLIGLFESLGRSGDIPQLFGRLSTPPGSAMEALGQAYTARAAGDFGAARTSLERAKGLLPGGFFAQLAGELADRDGDASAAFAQFSAMNRADAEVTPEWREGVNRYRDMLERTLAGLNNRQCSSLRASPSPDFSTRAAPLFLLSFPRSGTTLLDTFLMGHPGFEVHEERPFLDVAAAVTDTVHARHAYWEALDRECRNPAAVQVDKYPLATARAPLIHAMFPTARFVFALRHPCDVVLSCFMTRFRLNWGVSAFLHLEDTARVYDQVMRIWQQSRASFSLNVHEVRYEQLVASPEEVLRGIAKFAGVPFDQAMLEHRSTALARGMISTPSHAQVIEPLYQRSIGRWRQYRPMLDPHLAILKPWCETFGYDID